MIESSNEPPAPKITRFDDNVKRQEWIELPQSSSDEREDDKNNGQLVTMSGTITRGYQAGQMVDVHLELTDREIQKLTQQSSRGDKSCWHVGAKSGPHIVLLSIACVPIAFIVSACMAFYIGSTMWYNLYMYFSEERSIWHKIFLCPLLILTFPFTLGLSALGVALYASCVQVSWFYSSWVREIQDFEKGFYGWLCNRVFLPQCSPYEVVVLNDLDPSANPDIPTPAAV